VNCFIIANTIISSFPSQNLTKWFLTIFSILGTKLCRPSGPRRMWKYDVHACVHPKTKKVLKLTLSIHDL
jgi:hypothetical protein